MHHCPEVVSDERDTVLPCFRGCCLADWILSCLGRVRESQRLISLGWAFLEHKRDDQFTYWKVVAGAVPLAGIDVAGLALLNTSPLSLFPFLKVRLVNLCLSLFVKRQNVSRGLNLIDFVQIQGVFIWAFILRRLIFAFGFFSFSLYVVQNFLVQIR